MNWTAVGEGCGVALLFVSVVYQHFVYSRGIACHESRFYNISTCSFICSDHSCG
jgi:hypothetical protein